MDDIETIMIPRFLNQVALATAGVDDVKASKTFYAGNLSIKIGTSLVDGAMVDQATVAMFQAYSAHGTGASPSNCNDNNTVTGWQATAINQYAIIHFVRLVLIQRYRQYGAAGHNLDGRFKIQYYDLTTKTWTDWETGIAVVGAAWSGFSSPAAGIKVTTAVKIIHTTIDTSVGKSNIGEIEIIY